MADFYFRGLSLSREAIPARPFFSLTSVETGGIDLLRALDQGLVPPHYLQEAADSEKSLEAYLQDYLKEEVFAEGRGLR